MASLLSSGNASVLITVYYMLWITSFKSDPSSEITTDADAKDIYKSIVMIAVILSFGIMPLCGCIADKVPAYITLPLALGFRCVITL